MKRLLPLALTFSSVLGMGRHEQLELQHNNCVSSCPYQERVDTMMRWQKIADYMHGCAKGQSLSARSVEDLVNTLSHSDHLLTGFYIGAIIDRVPEKSQLNFSVAMNEFFGAGSERGNILIEYNPANNTLFMGNGSDVTIMENWGECALWPRDKQPQHRIIYYQAKVGGHHDNRNVRRDGEDFYIQLGEN